MFIQRASVSCPSVLPFELIELIFKMYLSNNLPNLLFHFCGLSCLEELTEFVDVIYMIMPT